MEVKMADDPNILVAFDQIDKLQSLKKKILNNTLNDRKDVQIIKRDMALLEQELSFSEKEVEEASKRFVDARNRHEKHTLQMKLYGEHLKLISKNHRAEQKVHLAVLMEAMKMQHVEEVLDEVEEEEVSDEVSDSADDLSLE